MPDTTERRQRAVSPETWRQLAWFLLLYLGGLASVVLLAYGIRLLWPF